METAPLLACFLTMLLLVWPAYLEDILDSPSFCFTYSVALACVYSRVSLITNGKATEEQKLKSCLATATEQAQSRLEELEGLQAKASSLTRTTTTLRRDITASRHREAESSKRAADYERENRRLRQFMDGNKDLAKDATMSA
jgi:hypothetical protein